MPAKPGPRRAHKLTDEVVAYAQQLREQDPTVGSARLAAAIAEKYAITVHPRSVERALARLAIPKVEARNETTGATDGDQGAVDGYEQLRRRALSGDGDGWRLRLAVL